ncbi:MAG: copper chaperone PCu(A)C [Vicinamibacterales bacterium]
MARRRRPPCPPGWPPWPPGRRPPPPTWRCRIRRWIDIYVTGATADAASTVELRGPAAGAAEPPVVPEFTVPACGSTSAAPTAPHLRLVGLSKPLAPGDTVQLTLTTDGGVKLTVAAPVRQP